MESNLCFIVQADCIDGQWLLFLYPRFLSVREGTGNSAFFLMNAETEG